MELGALEPAARSPLEPWPEVGDPPTLLTEIAEWLTGYGNLATRRTYAEGLGLPTSPADLRDWIGHPDSPWMTAVARFATAIRVDPVRADQHRPDDRQSAAADRRPPSAGRPPSAAQAGKGPPPPAPRGRLRPLHWFRWCASHRVDPLAATSTHVKAWLSDLADAGAAAATRDRLLATVKALYTHLADTGLAAGNPAALNRRRLGLVTTGATTGTVVLTAAQVRALYDTAAAPRRGAGPLDTARAKAVVALFTLGLRVSELCGLNRADLHVTRGRRALRVLGKGGKTRVVYLHAAAERAVTDYLHLKENAGTFPARRTTPVDTPLLVTRTGNRYQRQAVWQLLRRLATTAGDPLRDVAGAMHPHALRHFYVTTAVEAGAQLVHVQADVGHTSIDTTEQVYNSAARDPSRSAVDLVGEVLTDRADP